LSHSCARARCRPPGDARLELAVLMTRARGWNRRTVVGSHSGEPCKSVGLVRFTGYGPYENGIFEKYAPESSETLNMEARCSPSRASDTDSSTGKVSPPLRRASTS
jgi:hypothetical protein